MYDYRYRPAEEDRKARIEARIDAAMEVLGAIALAACILIPVGLWWFRLI